MKISQEFNNNWKTFWSFSLFRETTKKNLRPKKKTALILHKKICRDNTVIPKSKSKTRCQPQKTLPKTLLQTQ